MYFCPMQRIFLVLTLVCALSATTATRLDAQGDSLSWEARITYDASRINSPALRTASGIASDALIPLSLGVPVALYALGSTELLQSPADRRYMAETGLQTAVTMGTTYVLALGLKALVDRERPYQAYPGTIVNYRHDADGSFPSGHSAGSAALATSLSLRYPHWYVIGPSVAYALYTGFSRLNLGMHYLSDVLSGYALGVGVAVLVNALNNHLFDVFNGILPSNGGTEAEMQMGLIQRNQTTLFAVSIPL